MLHWKISESHRKCFCFRNKTLNDIPEHFCFDLAHLPEKPINPPKPNCPPLETSQLSSSHPPDQQHSPQPGMASLQYLPIIFFSKEFQVLRKLRHFWKDQELVLLWRFLSSTATLGGFAAERILVFCLGMSQMEKKTCQQCLVSAEASHGHFYHSILQDLILFLKEPINSRLTEYPICP